MVTGSSHTPTEVYTKECGNLMRKVVMAGDLSQTASNITAHLRTARKTVKEYSRA